MLPRNSYFPLIAPQIKSHFSASTTTVINNQETEMWLDYKGTPIKRHYPIGVLFDFFFANSQTSGLPWQLTVHFQGFPADQLLHCYNENTIKSYFTNTLKEVGIRRLETYKVNLNFSLFISRMVTVQKSIIYQFWILQIFGKDSKIVRTIKSLHS
jgi:autophagy-related protein 5